MSDPTSFAPPPAGLLAQLATPRVRIMLAIGSGLLLGLCMPGHQMPFAWTVVFVPLFLALDAQRRSASGGLHRRVLGVAGLCWWVGAMLAAVSGGWVVNTAHVYGGLPLLLAHVVNVLGYGTLQGLDTFLFLGLPFLLAARHPRRLPLLVLAWSAALPPLLPRFLYWTYGQLMFAQAPLVQAADLVGSSGLNPLVVGLNLLLAGALRARLAPWSGARRSLALAAALLALGFAAAGGYGLWRMQAIAERQAVGTPLQLVGVQPNFSLKALASNPALSPSDREQSVAALLADSELALERLPADAAGPIVVVWPESAYPGAYAYNPELRGVVERWVRDRRVHLVLATLDVDDPATPGEPRRVYGATVHVAPDGRVADVYRKIVLIPFGETIPLGDWFPWYRSLLRTAIPQISEFTPGDAYTVFDVAPGVRVAPMICFDAARQEVAAGMTRAGANLGFVLANLAWFGPTTVSSQFEQYIRFRAIENRIPMLMLSQNGTSLLFDARGEPASRRLGQFTQEQLALEVRLPAVASFYARHAPWVHGAFALLLGAVLGWLALSRRSKA
ncbi:MAG: apolipoprotein N-acyltransferase [Candidatus Lambdaproteobacteria bacterium]|nr:apolipoprotein N-acyltransferase [Candidatus Lambdaproteobacteria bacterium]